MSPNRTEDNGLTLKLFWPLQFIVHRCIQLIQKTVFSRLNIFTARKATSNIGTSLRENQKICLLIQTSRHCPKYIQPITNREMDQ